MKLESLKDLEKLIKLCRKTGVSSITVDGVTVELGSEPIRQESKASRKARSVMANTIMTAEGPVSLDPIQNEDELTEDQLLMWSAAPGGVTMTDGGQ